jgi:hypothetical protein
LVTAQVILKVGFAFYLEVTALPSWEKKESIIKKQGIPKSARYRKPPKNDNYPFSPKSP